MALLTTLFILQPMFIQATIMLVSSLNNNNNNNTLIYIAVLC